MGDVVGDYEVSDPGPWTRVRVRCSVKSMGWIGLLLELGSGSDIM